MNMADRIQSLRKSKGFSQEELADKSGVSRGTISALENGSIRTTTTKTLVRLSRALGVSVDQIFYADCV